MLKSMTETKLSLLDRFGLGFLNLLVALPTGVLLWVVLNGFPWAVHPWLPAISIVWFTAVMVLLGIITNSIVLVNFYGWVWRVLVKWFSLQ